LDGAHPRAASRVTTANGEVGLDKMIGADPELLLGADVVARFGITLPYLLKILAADSPLSQAGAPQY
jgi:mannose-6-phosphate isomerase